MRENWEWIKEAVRDMGGWITLVFVVFVNLGLVVEVQHWIATKDDGATPLYLLVLIWVVASIIERVTPARGIARTLTIKAVADEYQKRVDEWYSPTHPMYNKAKAAAEYLQSDYEVDMILRQSRRSPVARKNLHKLEKEFKL